MRRVSPSQPAMPLRDDPATTLIGSLTLLNGPNRMLAPNAKGPCTNLVREI
jgi:hypothetical protein